MQSDWVQKPDGWFDEASQIASFIENNAVAVNS
jgi:hypothetical protein